MSLGIKRQAFYIILMIRALQEGGSISVLLRKSGISNLPVKNRTSFPWKSSLFYPPCRGCICNRNLLSDTATSLQVLPYLNLLQQKIHFIAGQLQNFAFFMQLFMEIF